MSKRYKSCFVPCCTSTTVQTPDKIFVTAPKKKLTEWFTAARRGDLPNPKNTYYCCEDHLDVKEDTQNYLRYQMIGGYLRIKEGIVPYRFECQNPLTDKGKKIGRKREHMVTEISSNGSKGEVAEPSNKITLTESYQLYGVLNNDSNDIALNIKEEMICSRNYNVKVEPVDDFSPGAEGQFFDSIDINDAPTFKLEPAYGTAQFEEGFNTLKTENDLADHEELSNSELDNTDFSDSCDNTTKQGTLFLNHPDVMHSYDNSKQLGERIEKCDVAVQVNILSEGCLRCKERNCESDSSLDSLQILPQIDNESSNAAITTNSEKSDMDDAKVLSTGVNPFVHIDLTMNHVYKRENIFHQTLWLIEKFPEIYIGLSQKCLPLVIALGPDFKTATGDIYFTLMKIKLCDDYKRLAHLFNTGNHGLPRLFKSTVQMLAQGLKRLIFWPEKSVIEKHLPEINRKWYEDVQSIIHIIEIDIAKTQAKARATQSDSKKHVLKYLISSTPDGFINFLSTGYGGIVANHTIIEKSGYLSVVPSGCKIITAKPMTEIEPILEEKSCKLVVAPKLAKSVMKRVMQRIREFKMLRPQAITYEHFIPPVDDVLVTVVGLCNIKSPISQPRIAFDKNLLE